MGRLWVLHWKVNKSGGLPLSVVSPFFICALLVLHWVERWFEVLVPLVSREWVEQELVLTRMEGVNRGGARIVWYQLGWWQ